MYLFEISVLRKVWLKFMGIFKIVWFKYFFVFNSWGNRYKRWIDGFVCNILGESLSYYFKFSLNICCLS